MPTRYSESGTPDPALLKSKPPRITAPPRRLALESGAEIALMTEAQLERLLKRLAIVTREPRNLSAYATPQPPKTNAIGTANNVLLSAANKYRWGVALSAFGSGTISVSLGPTGNAANVGMSIAPAQVPLVLTYNDIGASILWEIRGTGNSPGAIIGWQEFEVPFPLDGTKNFTV